MSVEQITRYHLAKRFGEVMHMLNEGDVDGADQALQQVEADYGKDAYEYLCDLVAERRGIPSKDAPRP